MMKYIGFYWNVLAPLMKGSIKKRFGSDIADKAIKNGKEKYRYILEKANDLGNHNPLAHNAYFAYAFVAAWLGCDKALTPEQMGDVMGDVLHKVGFLFSTTDMNKKSHVEKYKKTLGKYIDWQSENLKKYPSSWNMYVDDVPNGLSYHFTSCPIAATCKKLGFPEIMPPLCQTDHTMAAIRHGKLKRNGTIADGADICDYWFIGDKDNFQ